jgi:two-component system phosphate regulon response regulator PhoB
MKKRILLKEDDSFITQMYASKIDEMGYEVKTASNEPEVKRILTKSSISFDLILLDLILPDVSGFDILEWIKKQENIQNIPVIVLSNLSSQADINQAFTFGVVDYIVKSNYTPSEIMRTVQKHLTN